MKRIFLALVVITGHILGVPNSADAAGGGSSCFSFGIPTVSSSSSAITVSVSISSKCERPFGLSSGGPVYSISEETMFSSSCEGPHDLSLFTSGTIICKIKLGGPLDSSRYGATTSTVKVWFAYDSGVKEVTFRHPSIPSKSSGGSSSGGSSGISPGGSSSNKTCTSAPSMPDLSVVWNSSGPLFQFAPARSGDQPTSLNWNYALYDSEKASWEAWSSWNSVYPAGAGSYQARAITGKTKIAFSVYSSNACGSSEQAREISTQVGVPLVPARLDSLRRIFPVDKKVQVGDIFDIYGIVSSELLIPLLATTSTNEVCTVSSSGNVQMLDSGLCLLRVSSKTYQQNIGFSSLEVRIDVSEKKQSQSILFIQLRDKYEISQQSMKMSNTTDANLAVEFESLTDDRCGILNGTVYFLKVGTCKIEATQQGNETIEAAEPQRYSIEIVDSRISLLCIKGKSVKKVIGMKPKCPVGFKVKK